jgi:1-acyl-sn-glycerol-3-phosphate acyltransferase
MNGFLRFVFRLVCKIDAEELKKLPKEGPLLVVGNHINFLETPVILPHLDNPNVTGFAKVESWDSPLFNFLFNRWKIIPIHRGTVDRSAFRLGEEALNNGKILIIAPEGTRNGHGRMLQGKPGIIAMALRSGVPIQPIAFYGYEDFWKNLKRLRRTEFHVVAGKPFRIKLDDPQPSKEVRQAATDEVMYKIAELLPEKYRGHYQFEGKIDYQYAVEE